MCNIPAPSNTIIFRQMSLYVFGPSISLSYVLLFRLSINYQLPHQTDYVAEAAAEEDGRGRGALRERQG